jgi:membrane associated rhomboid family serine protease
MSSNMISMPKSLSPLHTTSRVFRLHNVEDLLTLRGGQVSNSDIDEAKLEKFIKLCAELLSADIFYLPIKVLLLVNAAVFLMWRVCPTSFMIDNFIDSSKNRRNGRWWCGMLASISHIDFAHLAGNIGAYAVCGPPSLKFLGTFKFVTTMLLSSYLSTMISVWLTQLQSLYKSVDMIEFQGLGFSGLVCTLMVTYVMSERADHRQGARRASIMNSQLSSGKLLYTIAIGDCVGLINNFIMPNRSKIGHECHIGGYISGLVSISTFSLIDILLGHLIKFRKLAGKVFFRLFSPFMEFVSFCVGLVYMIFFGSFENIYSYISKLSSHAGEKFIEILEIVTEFISDSVNNLMDKKE